MSKETLIKHYKNMQITLIDSDSVEKKWHRIRAGKFCSFHAFEGKRKHKGVKLIKTLIFAPSFKNYSKWWNCLSKLKYMKNFLRSSTMQNLNDFGYWA